MRCRASILVALLGAATNACVADVASSDDPAPAVSETPPPPVVRPPPPPAPAPIDHGPTDPCSAGSVVTLVNGQQIWLPAECNPYTPYLGDPSPLGGSSPDEADLT